LFDGLGFGVEFGRGVLLRVGAAEFLEGAEFAEGAVEGEVGAGGVALEAGEGAGGVGGLGEALGEAFGGGLRETGRGGGATGGVVGMIGMFEGWGREGLAGAGVGFGGVVFPEAGFLFEAFALGEGAGFGLGRRGEGLGEEMGFGVLAAVEFVGEEAEAVGEERFEAAAGGEVGEEGVLEGREFDLFGEGEEGRGEGGAEAVGAGVEAGLVFAVG
jgi:hypothetical protein